MEPEIMGTCMGGLFFFFLFLNLNYNNPHMTFDLCYFQTLAKGGVTYRDEPWHKECFVCTNCKTQLAGQHFTSREDSPYCLKCFGSLYAKKCEACTKPITGKSYVLPCKNYF